MMKNKINWKDPINYWNILWAIPIVVSFLLFLSFYAISHGMTKSRQLVNNITG